MGFVKSIVVIHMTASRVKDLCSSKVSFLLLFVCFYKLINLFVFGCVGSSLLRVGFL